MSLQDTYNSQQDFQNSLLETFMSHVNPVIAKALLRLTSYLKGELTLKGNKIEQTAHNLNILRNLDKQYLKYLNQEGYQGILNAFVNQFPGGLPHLKDILEELSVLSDVSFPKIKFSASDLKVFSGYQITTKQALQQVIAHAAESARQQLSFSIGTIKFPDLINFLQDRMATTESRIKTIALTSLNGYQRTITARSFEYLEESFPNKVLRYKFINVIDSHTCIKCVRAVERTARAPMTKDEVQNMEGTPGYNPWVFGLHPNCRGIFLLSVADLATTNLGKTLGANKGGANG